MPKISRARKDERRRQILAAATTCFARRGFHRTTIQDICAEAQLSTGAVYSYFASKEAIIEALAEQGRQFAGKRAAGAQGENAALGNLRSFLREFELPGAAKVNQFDLRSWAEAIGNRQLRDIHLQARAETVRALREIAGPAAAAHGLAPEALAELVLAVIVGCETRRAIQPAADVQPVLGALLALLEQKAPKRRSAPT
ncbi:MAG TPA: helix-turn-helix domain-containing protein [Rhizomicrobium sp.]|jgi:TetR/AcrR family transcriptional repressor of uid operon|nr:helix-turn-helix domain-containing protein [Rhizomicrobium sp.]